MGHSTVPNRFLFGGFEPCLALAGPASQALSKTHQYGQRALWKAGCMLSFARSWATLVHVLGCTSRAEAKDKRG